MAQIHSRYYYPITIGKRATLEPYTFNMGKRSETTQYGNKRRESAERFNQIQNFDSHYQQMSRPRFEHERQISINAPKTVLKAQKISTNKLLKLSLPVCAHFPTNNWAFFGGKMNAHLPTVNINHALFLSLVYLTCLSIFKCIGYSILISFIFLDLENVVELPHLTKFSSL